VVTRLDPFALTTMRKFIRLREGGKEGGREGGREGCV